MERIVHKAKNFKEAERWDVKQQISMTSEQRQDAAQKLKIQYYGEHTPDVREFHKRT